MSTLDLRAATLAPVTPFTKDGHAATPRLKAHGQTAAPGYPPAGNCSGRDSQARGSDNSLISALIVRCPATSAEELEKHVAGVPGFAFSGTLSTGAETLRRLALERISLVLLDTDLPDMDGIDLMRAMRAAGCTSDVIVMTRKRDLTVVQVAAAYGMVHYLIKPFTFAALREKLERFRAYHGQLSAARPLVTQADIDSILAGVHATAPTNVPKGMSRESLCAVAAIVRSANETAMSATEVAATLGAARVTARRYLEYLVELKLVSRRPRYAGAHRPKVEYQWHGPQNGRDHRRGSASPPILDLLVHQ